jgi:hypothetical protein
MGKECWKKLTWFSSVSWYSLRIATAEGPEIHWLQNVCYLRSNECVCLCASVHVCVFVCVCWEPLHVGLLGLYIFCHFLWDTLFQKMAVTIVSRKSIISNRSNFRFCRSSTIYFVRRNFSAFREYVQCMSRPHDAWSKHDWLTKKDFNSSDCFMDRHLWIALCLFICINVAVSLPRTWVEMMSLHIIFLAWSFLKCWYCPLCSVMPVVQLLQVSFPMWWVWTSFVLFCVWCVCVFVRAIFLVWKSVNFFAHSNKFSDYKLFHTHCVYPLLRHE